MRISLRKAARWAVPAGLALFSQAAMALGLGNATVQSYLNQPLQVDIELITRPGETLNDVRAGLASAEDFALIGASREAISVPLRFDVRQEGDEARIRVTSNLPVSDPIIRIIVEVTWPSGRMLREYTLFLDPPTVAAAAPAPMVDERAGASSGGGSTTSAAARPEPESRPVDAGPNIEESGSDSPSSATDAGTQPIEEGAEYGPVQSGETLWRIASNWSQGSGLSMNQVMLAIQRQNPQAFINGNINLLRRGAVLRMPRRNEVESLSPEAALIEVTNQSSEFGASMPALYSASAVDTPLIEESTALSSPDTPEVEPQPDVQLEIVPPAESEGVDSAYGASDPDSDAAATPDTSALREELARTEEELISERQENEYLRERIAELEDQVAINEAGTVEDADLAAMEQRLREERLADAASSSATEAEPVAPAVEPAAADPVPQVRSAAADEGGAWYDNWVVWLLLVLVVGVAGAGWFLSRRTSGDSVESFLGDPGDDTVRDIKDEAEEILRVLRPADQQAPQEEAAEPEAFDQVGDDAGDEVGEPEVKPAPAAASTAADDGVIVDESDDPEVRLDLARAYVSMGDREAARVILAEVIEHGNEDQQAEARAMLEDL